MVAILESSVTTGCGPRSTKGERTVNRWQTHLLMALVVLALVAALVGAGWTWDGWTWDS
jgi:hypothetical protein